MFSYFTFLDLFFLFCWCDIYVVVLFKNQTAISWVRRNKWDWSCPLSGQTVSMHVRQTAIKNVFDLLLQRRRIGRKKSRNEGLKCLLSLSLLSLCSNLHCICAFIVHHVYLYSSLQYLCTRIRTLYFYIFLFIFCMYWILLVQQISLFCWPSVSLYMANKPETFTFD